MAGNLRHDFRHVHGIAEVENRRTGPDDGTDHAYGASPAIMVNDDEFLVLGGLHDFLT